ncbi:MAG: hypothetical protein KKH94_04205 [Candidatus Omnitrophica bacterium]|nr:hypothetical protein [Candidatus Omnitrophota bacterium]
MTIDKKDTDWKTQEQEIGTLFSEYSVKDVSMSLLCISLWLPNLSSQIKNSYLTLHLITRNEDIFQSEDQINIYEDFRSFAEKLIELTPSFPSVEDYFPETDWGEIKFYFQNEIYKIFYGNEITDIYDYLALFDIKYVAIDKQFKEKIQRSPADELRTCLSLQDGIISFITQSITEEKRQSIHNGHFEVPDEKFWEGINSIQFDSNLKRLTTDDILREYAVSLGTKKFAEDINDFIHGIIYGLYAACYFLENKGKYYVLNPRRYSCILIEKWFGLYQMNKEKLFDNNEHKNFSASYSLARFINQRIMNEHKFEMISATFDNGKPHQSIFASAILHEDKMVLFYLLDEDADKMEDEVQIVNEAIELLKSKPYTLALHLDRQNMRFQPTATDKNLEPIVIYLYPNICIEGAINARDIPESLVGEFFDMTSFLGILDEIKGIDDFLDFCDYLKNDQTPIMHLANLMDRYAAYRDSHKILSEGAQEFNMMWLDPHWGAGYKYERLKEFWAIYPDRNYFDHPRSWRPEVNGNRVRLVARGYRGCALFSKVVDSNVFVTAPYNNMNLEEAKITDMQLMCLDDYITNTADILQELTLFSHFKDINITFIPSSLISRDDSLKHLKGDAEHLELRRGAVGIIKDNIFVMRIVFDVEETTKLFFEPGNNEYEVDFIVFVLRLFNRLGYDRNMEGVIDKIKERYKDRKPRHTLMAIDTGVCFNERTPSAIVPDQHAFKAARKRVAEIVRSLNIEPGDYQLEEAKRIINLIRDKFIEEIDSYVTKYNFAENIKTLIQNIESLTHNAQSKLALIEKTVVHEVDYDRVEKFNEVHTEFLARHRDYRYVIEKFVQHSGAEGQDLIPLDIQYLLAFSNELGHLYNTSNVIHYGLYPIGLNISNSYIFNAIEEENLDAKSEIYGKAFSADQIFDNNEEDRTLDSEEERKSYQQRIDEVFKEEKGFTITNLINVCVILANYPAHDTSIANSSHYIASRKKIITLCNTVLENSEKDEIDKILCTLTLDKEKMTMIIGDPNVAKDLPVWEHYKRPNRYTIKPFIVLNDGRLLWGPYSVKKAHGSWVKRFSEGSSPYNMENARIEELIANRKDDISRKLEDKSYEIVNRHTEFAEKNFFLYMRDKEGTHPSDLGDYDVLAYIKEKNLILNIECKDLLGAYCSKDAKRLRDKLYGEPKDRNYISKVIKREEYLTNNLEKIFDILGWKSDDISQLKICSIFTVRQLFWWHLFPSYKTNVEFVKVSKLDEYLKGVS